MTNGSDSPGVRSDAGGAVVLNGGSVATTGGAGSPGLYAVGVIGGSGAASTISAANVAVSTANAIGLYATGVGASISTAGTTVATTGANANGAQADTGGALVLNGGLVTTSGQGSIGLFASGVASTITATSLTTTTGAGARAAPGGVGVYASAQGAVALNDGFVTTYGASAAGLYASGAGSSITTELVVGPGLTLVTNGSDSPGVRSDAGGAVVLNGGSVATTGGAGSPGLYAVGVIGGSGAASTISAANVAVSTANAIGLYATGVGASISTTGTTVATTGANANGAQADTGGALVLNGGLVTTSGQGSIGVASISSGGASLNGVSITTLGQDSHGLMIAGSGSQASLAGANAIATRGDGAIALAVRQGGVLTAAGTTTVTTSGAVSGATGYGAYGVNADGAGSTVTLASAIVRTSGVGAVGLLASDAAGSGAAGSITVNGTLNVQTTNPAAAAIALQGSGATISATGGGTIVSAGDAIAFLGGTNQTATFDNLTIANQGGDLIFADPSAATINFSGATANAGTNNLLNATGGSFVTVNAAASALTGVIRTDSASTSTVNLTNGSSWTMTGSSVVSNLAVANSFVVFAPPGSSAGFKTLTLGNYAGSGGFVTMNATLGGTGSASDQIVINGGKATGSTLLTIRNVGGGGAQTIGAGIPVIVAVNGGTIGPNAFALADTLAAGGYRYTLEQSGQDFYLVSTPTTTQTQMTNSVTNVAKAQQQALVTGKVLGSILLGATEQVNCSNCSSGFGSIGSYALGAHGRTSLTPELTAMGGFSYNEYSAEGIAVTNAPTFGGSLVYDPSQFRRQPSFFEIGGGFVPFEQIHYTRTLPDRRTDLAGRGQRDQPQSRPVRSGWLGRPPDPDRRGRHLHRHQPKLAGRRRLQRNRRRKQSLSRHGVDRPRGARRAALRRAIHPPFRRPV